MSRRTTVLLLLTCLLTACGRGPSATDLEDLDRVLSSAAGGDMSGLNRLARRRGDGSWFALSMACEDAGYPDLARSLRIRSARFDDPPFGALSLTGLLIDDPDAISCPLIRIRSFELRGGPADELRRARIGVLDGQGATRRLAREMSGFRGTAWEAPVLAAVLTIGPDSPILTAQTERYILHCPDPSALNRIAGVLPADINPVYVILLEARMAFAAGRTVDALYRYRAWLDGISASDERESCDLEGPPPVFAEMARVFRSVDDRESGASLLRSGADRLTGGRRYGAALQAGILYRESRKHPAAADAFRTAAESVPPGADRDRALRYLLLSMYDSGSAETVDETAIWAYVTGSWHNPAGFTTLLEEWLHRRVRRGEWDLLGRVRRERASDWPGEIRSASSLVLAFAVHEGRTTGDLRAHLDDAFAAAPLSWPGLRAAGLLDADLSPLISDAGNSGTDPTTDADKVIRLLLSWGLLDRATGLILEDPSIYDEMSIRLTAQAAAAADPRLSIRIIGLLPGSPSSGFSLDDLKLRHPVPLDPLPRQIAESEGLPPAIIMGLVRTESAWDERAVSRSGAMGLGQFMPATWAEWVDRLGLPADSDPMNPATNLKVTAAYLEWLYEREWTFGWIDTLASYNGGGGRMRAWRSERPGYGDDLFGYSIPLEEPRSYVGKVLSAATLYGYIYSGESPRSLHEKWGLVFFEVN